MAEQPTMGSRTRSDGYVDGGVVLLARGYDDDAWRQVREGWWWHAVAMVALAPVYPVIALTVWQRPSHQPVVRRAIWAVLLTLGALLVVGLPAFVVFSRRWYWRFRTGTSPVERRSAIGDRDRGYLGWVEVCGRSSIDRITGVRTRSLQPDAAHAALPEPWGPLRHDAAVATRRIGETVSGASGTVASALARAQQESLSAYQAVARVAASAARAERRLEAMDRSGVVARLAVVGEQRGDPGDLLEARRALEEQLAVAARVEATIGRLEGQLHRMVAQLGEVAALAEELVVGPPGLTPIESAQLAEGADALVSIRLAIEAVEDADPSPWASMAS